MLEIKIPFLASRQMTKWGKIFSLGCDNTGNTTAIIYAYISHLPLDTPLYIQICSSPVWSAVPNNATNNLQRNYCNLAKCGYFF